jgi:hypothetical protein
LYKKDQERQRKNTGDTINKKDKGQTQATNGQERQRTSTGNIMYKKDKEQTQAIQ